MSLMTAEELKAQIPDTSEDDPTLEARIADTETELNRRFGSLEEDSGGLAEVTETIYAPGLTMLALTQEPDSVSSVTDRIGSGDQAIDDDPEQGYKIRGKYLVRQVGTWGRWTTVVYTPLDERAARRRVLVKLIQLDMNYQPGLGSAGGGSYSESYFGKGYLEQREQIMAALGEPELFA